ncbi:hypothetical protein TNCV_1289501 [Trichonephila clavipes]|nr:hypothetical protein TNCV_1289501 [Trichonephila clavipes]
MDDNATGHRTLAVQDCLDSEGIQRLVWPACSSDLNPIENVWDALGRQVAGRNYPPTNKNTSSVHSQRNGINCLNSCWIIFVQTLMSRLMLCYVAICDPFLAIVQQCISLLTESSMKNEENIASPNFCCVAKFEGHNHRAAGVAIFKQNGNTKGIITVRMEFLYLNRTDIRRA